MATQGLHASASGSQVPLSFGRQIQLDGIVSGNAATSSRPINRWAVFLIGLVAIVFLLLAASGAIFTIMVLVAGFILLGAIVKGMAGGTGAGVSAAMSGVFSVAGAISRFVVGLLMLPSRATAGHGPLMLDATSFRLTDQGGAVYNCVAEGDLAAGTIRNGDHLTVKGRVGRDRSVKVSTISNVRTGTISRPRKPMNYWFVRAAEIALVVVGVTLVISWLGNR